MIGTNDCCFGVPASGICGDEDTAEDDKGGRFTEEFAAKYPVK